ncbi:MAG TPA: type IV pilus twitching motility protein PilT [Candidatus Omnitrophota bacterium]|nr:type IV pilus twitching motility protein PilT [Candidatus Omnitrophota bacterium]
MNDILQKLLVDMIKKDASDLHITANTPINYRIDGDLVAATDHALSPDDAKSIIFSLLDDEQILRFEKERELDFAFSISDSARYRANIFYQRGFVGCAIRMIPYKIRGISECGLPEQVLKEFCKASKGLILITGATGSGKSTTMAAMIDEINSTRKCHIVTVEDPIEFVHQNKKSVIDQREVHSDTKSFPDALRHVLRQDPDVILIGELRDLESIHQAMVIADTGHLVFGTLHTSDSIQTINRIIDVFPAHQQKQIRTQLSFVLIGVISQQLIPKMDKGRVLAAEVLIVTSPVKSMVRDERVHQIYSTLQTSSKIGMQTMNQSLVALFRKGVISHDDMISSSSDVEELLRMLESPVGR